MPRVLNKRYDPIPEDAVYVGRPSIYGNPFAVIPHGPYRQGEAVEEYHKWIMLPEQDSLRLKIKWNLKGKDLVCWCVPKPCHANILLEIANDHY